MTSFAAQPDSQMLLACREERYADLNTCTTGLGSNRMQLLQRSVIVEGGDSA